MAPPQQPTLSVVKPEGRSAASVKPGQEGCVRSSGTFTLSARGPSDSWGGEALLMINYVGVTKVLRIKALSCSETTLTGESRFRISTPQGIWTCAGSPQSHIIVNVNCLTVYYSIWMACHSSSVWEREREGQREREKERGGDRGDKERETPIRWRWKAAALYQRLCACLLESLQTRRAESYHEEPKLWISSIVCQYQPTLFCDIFTGVWLLDQITGIADIQSEASHTRIS